MLGTYVANLRGRGTSGTYSNAPCTKEGYKKFPLLAILVEFFVIALFHETKIPMVDMNIQVSSNFSNFLLKKLKSPSSMTN
jgi:hypothetical protein